MVMLKWILSCEDVNWIHLAEDRVQWRILVNTVMKVRVPWKAGSSWLSKWPWIRQYGGMNCAKYFV